MHNHNKLLRITNQDHNRRLKITSPGHNRLRQITSQDRSSKLYKISKWDNAPHKPNRLNVSLHSKDRQMPWHSEHRGQISHLDNNPMGTAHCIGL
jgi:hypothetical protein